MPASRGKSVRARRPHSTLVWKWPVVLAVLMCTLIVVAGDGTTADTSVLGKEPGDVRLRNDDIGVILWGPDTAPTLSIGKSDVWDRHSPPPSEPVLTLAQITAMAHAGDSTILNGAAYYTAYNSYDFPCPKPVGQLILRLDFLGSDGLLTVKRETHALRLTASSSGKVLELRLFVSAVRNVIVLSGKATGLEAGDVAIRLYRHRDTIVPGGALHPTLSGKTSRRDFEPLPMPRVGVISNSMLWLAQDLGSDLTFPTGFTSVLAARMAGATMDVEVAEGQMDLGTPMVASKENRLNQGSIKRYAPINQAQGSAATGRLGKISGPLQLFAVAVTSQDDRNPLERAQRELNEAVHLGADALWAEHEKHLDAYEARPHARAWSKDGSFKLDVPWGGQPYHPRPFGYYGDAALCSVGSTQFCTQDSAGWHADFHFNVLDATSFCMERQFDLLESYFALTRSLLLMAQRNAREVYACSGAMYPLMHYPLKASGVIHSHLTWEQSMEMSALVAKPFWLRFLYTWDTEFLRESAYPVLREGARFYADFLRRSSDGLYHVIPTVSGENRGITKNFEFNKDSQSAITLIRYHLKAAARGAELLGQEEMERARWRDIAQNLPPYPTVQGPDGPIFSDVADAKPIEYNIPVSLAAVFWGDDIGLDSPAEQLEIARRTVRSIKAWGVFVAACRKRLGILDLSDSLSLENVLQSHTGAIHVFPVVPTDFVGGFENLGAEGGFIVAGERSNAGVRSVTITSLAGNPCAVANPWPGGQPEVVTVPDSQHVSTVLESGILRFSTKAGRRYRVQNQS